MNEDTIFKIRQILNIVFMVGAVVGVIIYLVGDKFIGTVVILCAMAFKMMEYIIRFMRPRK